MCLSYTVFDIYGVICRRSQIFPILLNYAGDPIGIFIQIISIENRSRLAIMRRCDGQTGPLHVPR